MEKIERNLISFKLSSLLAILFIIAFGIYLNSVSSVTGIIWVFSILAGITLQRSRLCFASSFRDLFLFGSTKTLKSIILGLMTTSFLFIFVMRSIIQNPTIGSIPADPYILPFGVSTIVGGVLFGFGMVIAGGCVSGSLYRIGEGYVASLFSILGVVTGLITLSLSWEWWWDNLISNEPKIWLPKLFDMGYLGAFIVTLILGITVYIGLTVYESKKGFKEFKIASKPKEFNSFKEKLFSPLYTLFKMPWNMTIGVVVLGLISTFLLIVSKPFGVTGELFSSANNIVKMIGLEPATKGLSELGGCVANAASNSNYFSNSFAATYGIIPGSFLASKLSGEFKIRMPKNPVRLAQSFGGGLFMGYGAGLAIGCTLGSFFSAIPSMSLSGWLFGLSLAIGAFLGTKIISRF
tara:strand:- start:1250 stop:2470 length:1221 start_codon:yes stop_codon:yes gene_type:complete